MNPTPPAVPHSEGGVAPTQRTEFPLLRWLLVAALLVLLIIPLGMIGFLVADRERAAGEARHSVESMWSGPQRTSGPVLAIPCRWVATDESGTEHRMQRTVYLLPERLKIDGNLRTEHRPRGLRDVALYRSELDFQATFRLPESLRAAVEAGELSLAEARIRVGIADIRGVDGAPQLEWGAALYPFDAQPQGERRDESLLAVAVDARPLLRESVACRIALKLRGSESLRFVPVGSTTEVGITSDCTTPSFTGRFLPEEREVDDRGFTARWSVGAINRGFGMVLDDEEWALGSSDRAAFGFDQLVPVTEYRLTMRTVKYAFLVIVLIYTALFFADSLLRRPVNPLHYLLIGLSLVLFYLLLLALAEHTGFGWAYAVAAVLTIGSVALFLGSVADRRTAGVVAALLVLLYTYLYALLQMEEYALLIGSLGLFVALVAVMAVTAHIHRTRRPEPIC